MKAICLHQPHASAMRANLKRNETRGRLTHFRGDLAICSTRKLIGHDRTWDRAFLKRAAELLDGGAALGFEEYIDGLPHGFVLCIVEVYDCIPTAQFIRGADRAKLPLRTLSPEEEFWGNYAPGRFGWLTRRLRILKEPVKVTGRQFLFDLPPDVEAAVRAQLTTIAQLET